VAWDLFIESTFYYNKYFVNGYTLGYTDIAITEELLFSDIIGISKCISSYVGCIKK